MWKIDLLQEVQETTNYRSFLSRDEIQRADNYRFDLGRNHFIVARAVMRKILAGYVNLEPQQLVFSYGAKGKPELHSKGRDSALEFNLSHSRDVALLAVTRGGRVGVDIEFVNSEIAADDLAARFFAAGEIRALEALPANRKVDAFFSCWTRKEAYIKALGVGLSLPLDGFEVNLDPGLPAMLVRPDLHDSAPWSMYDVDASPGYKAALVVEGDGRRCRHLGALQNVHPPCIPIVQRDARENTQPSRPVTDKDVLCQGPSASSNMA